MATKEGAIRASLSTLYVHTFLGATFMVGVAKLQRTVRMYIPMCSLMKVGN